jgi:hypothetical protein
MLGTVPKPQDFHASSRFIDAIKNQVATRYQFLYTGALPHIAAAVRQISEGCRPGRAIDGRAVRRHRHRSGRCRRRSARGRGRASIKLPCSPSGDALASLFRGTPEPVCSEETPASMAASISGVSSMSVPASSSMRRRKMACRSLWSSRGSSSRISVMLTG